MVDNLIQQEMKKRKGSWIKEKAKGYYDGFKETQAKRHKLKNIRQQSMDRALETEAIRAGKRAAKEHYTKGGVLKRGAGTLGEFMGNVAKSKGKGLKTKSIAIDLSFGKDSKDAFSLKETKGKEFGGFL